MTTHLMSRTSRPPRRVRAGWSRTALPISPDMVVVDIGSGTFPNARADILCERDLIDNRHRGGLTVTVDRPLVRGDGSALPFRDRSIDFVIASHIAEHVDDPVAFCAELSRVATAGYIETPSPLFETLFDVEYHSWKVGYRDGEMIFTHKQPRPRWLELLTEPLYRIYFADQPSPSRPAYRIPSGRVGRAVRFGLRGVFGVINRSGVLHTRVQFRPGMPLRCRVA